MFPRPPLSPVSSPFKRFSSTISCTTAKGSLRSSVIHTPSVETGDERRRRRTSDQGDGIGRRREAEVATPTTPSSPRFRRELRSISGFTWTGRLTLAKIPPFGGEAEAGSMDMAGGEDNAPPTEDRVSSLSPRRERRREMQQRRRAEGTFERKLKAVGATETKAARALNDTDILGSRRKPMRISNRAIIFGSMIRHGLFWRSSRRRQCGTGAMRAI
mmetsp:Transcript_16446/g.47266  ORF Transcript_16446/g.47266 Transcript_16446/m.47266 type:complete len:216 (+) Transcript_16446:1191-1838(+)